VEFDFDSQGGKGIILVGSCLAHPQLSIALRKDATAIIEECFDPQLARQTKSRNIG
jgi:hypothetical protein